MKIKTMSASAIGLRQCLVIISILVLSLNGRSTTDENVSNLRINSSTPVPDASARLVSTTKAPITVTPLTINVSSEATIKSSSTTPPNSNATIVSTHRRLVGVNSQRDDKLMSLVQARRRSVQTRRWRSVEDCIRQCRTTNTDEYCRLKCSRHRIISSNSSRATNSSSIRSSQFRNNTKLIEFKTSDTNLISQNGDELFDTEESVHGLFFVDPSTKNDSKTSKQTKENTNLLTSNSNDNKSNSKDLVNKNNEVTTKSNEVRKLKYSRTNSHDMRAKRIEALRNRDRLQTNTERSFESIDPEHFANYGQKISTTNRSPPLEPRGQTTYRRAPQSRQGTKPQEEEVDEIMEYSVPRQSSTEKNKFWKTRNIIALSNHFRRNSALYPSTTQPNKKLDNVTTTTTIRYNTIHRQRVEKTETPISAINNLEETTPTPSNISLSQSEILIPVPLEPNKVPNTSFYRPFGLVINIPEDATPHGVFLDEPVPVEIETETAEVSNYYESVVPPETTEPIKIEYTTITRRRKVNPSRSSNSSIAKSTVQPSEKNFSVIPSINQLFQNISTISPATEQISEEIPSSVSSSTSKSISKSTVSTSIRSTVVPSESPILTLNPITTRKAPVTQSTEPTITTTTIATISSVLNNTSSRNREFDVTTQSPTVSTTYNSTAEETKNSSLPLSPALDYEIVPPPILTLTPITTKTNTNFQNNANKTEPNDVKVEMHTMTPATFILGGLGVLPIIAVILFVIRQYVYRNEDKDGDLERYSNDIQPISPVVRLDQSDSASTTDESIITDRDFSRNNLRFKSLLGEGNFGQVWKAEADDLNGHLGTTRIVAVKTERVDNGQGGLKAEGEIMRKLGSHPNVVTLLGMCIEQEPHMLIMEYAMRGRLLSLLRAARGVINGLQGHNNPNRQPIMPLSPRRLTGFAHDIARGMEYIAEKRIVHRDLAARNVLLDHNGICKICDFGMSKDLDKVKASQGQLKIPRIPTTQPKFKFDMTARVFGGFRNYANKNKATTNCDTKNRPALPIRWMAVEALQYNIYSVETDVWAFGIVLWEIATLGITPYPTLSGREVIRGVPNGIRPEIPPDCRPELYEVMTRCWHKDPRQRPSFTEARKILARALCQWTEDTSNTSEYLDVSGFSEDLEHGMIYFNKRVSEFECEI